MGGWGFRRVRDHQPINYMVLCYHCYRKHHHGAPGRHQVVGGARWWMGPVLPVQAVGGGPAESGASQQSHSLLPVQRVETTGPGAQVTGQRLPCSYAVDWLFRAAAEGASRSAPLLLRSPAPIHLAPPHCLSSPYMLSPHQPLLLTCVRGSGWASETSSWPCRSESCDWTTSPGRAPRGWSCGSLAHCGGSLDRK